MKRSLKWETLVLSMSILALAAVPAKANLLPFLASETAGAAPGTTNFNYSVSLSNDERIDGQGLGNTAFFTIYDFAGYVPGTITAPANWTASAQNVGITPVGVTVTDSSSVVNLTFTYTGAVTIAGTGQTFSGFYAASTDSLSTTTGMFSQQSTKNVGLAAGGRDFGAGPETIPVAGNTPEPSTIVLLGAGLALVAAKARKRFV